MAFITLSGYVYDADGNPVSGLEARAFTVDGDTKTSTANTDTTDSNGKWLLSSLNTDSSPDGVYAVRIQDTSSGNTRWIDPTDLQVNSIVGPNGEAPIADGSITSSKIATSAVTTSKIADEAITESKLHPDVVAQLGGGGGGGDGLTANSVTSTHIVNGTIQAVDLANGSVTNSKINNLAVTSAKIASSAVTSSKIADGAVTNDKIANLSVTSSKLATNSVTGSKIASSAVTGSKIASSTISESKLDSALRAKINSSGGTTNDILFSRTTGDQNLSSSMSQLFDVNVSMGAGKYLFIVTLDVENTGSSRGTMQFDLLVAGVFKGSSQGLGVATLGAQERMTVTKVWTDTLSSGTTIVAPYAQEVSGQWVVHETFSSLVSMKVT